MNIRKLTKENLSKDDSSSIMSTPTTSKIMFDNYDSNYEADKEDNTLDDDDYDVESLQNKLECLTEFYFEKKHESAVLKRCIEVQNVSNFMNDLFSKKKLKHFNSGEQKRTIIGLYKKNRELCKRLKILAKKNKNTTKEIFRLYIDLEELMEERKKVWDRADKLYSLSVGDSSAFLNFDETELFDESTYTQKEKHYCLKGIEFAILMKAFQTVQVSKILYNLIANSEVSWGKDENLLEILECTSKVFDRNFDLKKRNQFMKIVEEVTQRLDKVNCSM